MSETTGLFEGTDEMGITDIEKTILKNQLTILHTLETIMHTITNNAYENEELLQALQIDIEDRERETTSILDNGYL